MKLWHILPKIVRELLEAPYRREARIEVDDLLKRRGLVFSDILDIGAGDCFAEKFFSENQNYVPVDLEPRNNKVRAGDVRGLDFPDRSFDLVLCLEVLEYIPEPIEALREIFRVLRSGGRIVLTTPLLATGDHGDFHRWSLSGIDSVIKRAGFNIERIRPMGGYYRMLGWQISKISHKLKKPKLSVLVPIYYVLKIPLGIIFQILLPLMLFSFDWLDRDKRDTCGYVCLALKP